MSNLVDQIKEQFKQGTYVTRLIYLNVGVFLAMLVIRSVSFLASGDPESFTYYIRLWFALPSDPIMFITRPWSLFTYMFLHADFWHLLWNMVILFFAGRLFMEYLGERRLLTVFVYGGLAGGMLFFVLYNISPAFTTGVPLVGASAGVVAVLVAAATYVPNMEVRLFGILPIKLWIIAALSVVSYVIGITGSNSGGHLAHLGGAALGYFFVVQLRKGNDWSEGFIRLTDTIEGWFKPKSPLKKVYTNTKGDSRSNAKKTSQNDQARMDAILDKISKNGYDKLSKEEKDFLFKFGKK